MIQIGVIDMASIEHGLEKGLGRIEYMSLTPEHLRLRRSVCGIASTAIAKHLARRNIQSELVISNPQFSFDQSMRHVFLHAELGDETMLIDPTYSQFLEYAGLGYGYAFHTGHDAFPEEKIAMTRSREFGSIVRTLTDASLRFRDIRRPVAAPLFRRIGHGPLDSASPVELERTFERIWAPRNQAAFIPSREIRTAATMLADSIDEAYASV